MANYEDLTVEELKDHPRYSEIEGRSSMNKDELVAALNNLPDGDDESEETKSDAEAFDAAKDALEESKEVTEELGETEDTEREPNSDSQERAFEIAGSNEDVKRVGFASDASDADSNEVRNEVSDAAVLDSLSDEEAALADVALDSSGPLKLESPSERVMTGALTEEEALEQLEKVGELPEDYVGEIRADGTAPGREGRTGSGPNGEVLQEDVIDFPGPLGENEEARANESANKRRRAESDFVKSRAAQEVFPDEGPQVARDRLFQQRGQFYTDGVSGQAEHNLALSYRVHDLQGGNYHVNPDDTAREQERKALEKDRVEGDSSE